MELPERWKNQLRIQQKPFSSGESERTQSVAHECPLGCLYQAQSRNTYFNYKTALIVNDKLNVGSVSAVKLSAEERKNFERAIRSKESAPVGELKSFIEARRNAGREANSKILVKFPWLASQANLTLDISKIIKGLGEQIDLAKKRQQEIVAMTPAQSTVLGSYKDLDEAIISGQTDLVKKKLIVPSLSAHCAPKAMPNCSKPQGLSPRPWSVWRLAPLPVV